MADELRAGCDMVTIDGAESIELRGCDHKVRVVCLTPLAADTQ